MADKLDPNRTASIRGLVKYVHGRGCFRAVSPKTVEKVQHPLLFVERLFSTHTYVKIIRYSLLCTYKYTLLWWQIDQAASSRFSKTFLYFFFYPSLTGDLLIALESLDEFVFDRR